MLDMGVVSVVAAMNANAHSLDTQRNACHALATLAEKADENKVWLSAADNQCLRPLFLEPSRLVPTAAGCDRILRWDRSAGRSHARSCPRVPMPVPRFSQLSCAKQRQCFEENRGADRIAAALARRCAIAAARM
jgi:hypothetical protein